MSFGGMLGFGDQLFPLLWSYLNYDLAEDGYVLDITKEQLAEALKFKASDTPGLDTGYRQDVAWFYGSARLELMFARVALAALAPASCDV